MKTSPITSNPQVFKQTRNSTKTQAQISGKTTRLATLLESEKIRSLELEKSGPYRSIPDT